MSADGVPEPVEMCSTDPEDAALDNRIVDVRALLADPVVAAVTQPAPVRSDDHTIQEHLRHIAGQCETNGLRIAAALHWDAAEAIDTLQTENASLTAQLVAARKALAQSQAQNVRLARMALNVPDEAPSPLLYAPRFPSPTRMHSPL